MNHKDFQKHVQSLYKIVDELEKMFPGRPFTPDGHMVGSIAECLVAEAYDLKLMPPSNKGFDAKTKNGKKVEIKATQARSVAFRSCPEHTIIIKIFNDGTFEECFNGPGGLIWNAFKGKKVPSNGQFQISLNKVKEINKQVSVGERVNKISGYLMR